jgi:hypothetical protein
MAPVPRNCYLHAPRCGRTVAGRTIALVDMLSAKQSGNSPFMVAVSGHRDLDPGDISRLREAVTDFVQQLRAHLPDTELRLIVGMAEGADLLVAETALGLGVPVEAVLPMPLEHYAADFDASTLARLKELLRNPRVRCVELSAHIAAAADGPHSREQRDAMYANLTDTLIRRSGLLLALWDGRGSHLPGGTADTVLRYLAVRNQDNRVDDTVEFLQGDDAETGADSETLQRLVYWTPAARSGASGAPPVQSPCYLRGAGDNVLQIQRTMPVHLKRQLVELNSYNLEYARLTAAGKLAAPESLMASLPIGVVHPPNAMLEDIDIQYGKADALAVYYQRRSDLLFDLFAFMAFAMGVAYLIYEKLTDSRALLLAYLSTLLTSLGVYYVLQGKRWFGKHLTYRALAETLRARYYLRLAGADQRMDAAEVLALSGIERFRGFGWIGFVLKGIEAADDHAAPDRSLQMQSVEQAWIEGQFRYFTRKVARLEAASRRVKHLRHFLFVAILVIISLLFAFGEQLHRIDMGLGIPVKNMLTFLMGFMAVLLGVWELHQDKMATRELLWQYRNQLSHFARAKAQLARMATPRRRNDVLVELGKDSLMESYLWAIHRYHREHEPPTA